MKDFEIIIDFKNKNVPSRNPIVTGLDEKHAITQALNSVRRSLPDEKVKSVKVRELP